MKVVKELPPLGENTKYRRVEMTRSALPDRVEK
jgi:hypothetical protein